MPNVNKLQKYLKADGCQDGDIITFLTAGVIESREFDKDGEKEEKDIFEILVLIGEDKKLYSPNATTRKLLSKAWGPDTEKWVGQKARISILPAPNNRDMIICKPLEAREAAQARNSKVSEDEVPF